MIRREALLLMLGAAAAGRWPGAKEERAAQLIGTLAAADWLRRREFMMYDVGEVHALHYAEVATALGAMRLAIGLKDHGTYTQIAVRFRRTIDEALPNTRDHVDANIAGAWPLEMWQNGLVRISDRDLGLALADGQWAQTTPDGLTTQARYWIDDIWMIGALQLAAWRATRKPVYLDRAALMARLYVLKLQQPNGLFHHGPDAPFCWGRGNGWVAAGLAEILSELPHTHPDHATIAAAYTRMMKALLATQAEDGMWRQLIDHPEAWKETSGTAMFGFAMALGVRRRLLRGRKYDKAARKAWAALTTYVEADGRLSQVCVGTGQSKEAAYYLARPTVTGDLHGQAALLWFAAEMTQH